jgi:hypothetical protein
MDDPMTEHDDLDLAEISAHQFTEPLKPPAKVPNVLVRAFAAAVSGRVWFRVGWTCPHLKAVLESAEEEMLLRGELDNELDIYQLQGGAAASAGTHSKPGAADLGQTSDAQITTLRRNGGNFQRRTPAQGFVLHAHGFAQGCTCGSSSLLNQKRLWNRRLNGLVSNGPVIGLWPTKNWKTAVAERKKVIMALKDDIAAEIIARIRKEYDAIADAVLTRDGKIANTITGNAANKTVTLAGALTGLGRNTTDIPKQVLTRDGLVANTYNPTDPNREIALATAVGALMARQRTQDAKLDAIIAALKGTQA